MLRVVSCHRFTRVANAEWRRLIHQRLLVSQRGANPLLLVPEAALGRVRDRQIEDLAPARAHSLKCERKRIRAQVPIGSAGKHLPRLAATS